MRVAARRRAARVSGSFRRVETTRRGVFVRLVDPGTADYQREAAERLHLPFPLLSDAALTDDHGASGCRCSKPAAWFCCARLTLVIRDGVIERVFYPVFPPDRNAAAVVRWLADQPAR